MRKIFVLAVVLLAGCDSEPSPVPKPSPKPRPAAPKPVPPPPAPTPTPTVRPVNPLLSDPSNAECQKEAPAEFKVKFETSRGDFVVKVTRAWAPNGADRFYNLVRLGYYDDACFYRVVPGFMTQWGMAADPKITQAWSKALIKDDPVVESNKRGKITFAMRGPNTRTTQLFINYADKNAGLDRQGFSPFGEIIEGMGVVDGINSEYGEAPDQRQMSQEGNAYLDKYFPRLDRVKSTRIME